MSYDEHIAVMTETKMLSVGDKVKVLIDYSLHSGTILKINQKSIKVQLFAEQWRPKRIGNFKREKVFKYGTLAVLVWELWKGKNGRGSYRIDTQMYTDLAKPIEEIPASSYLYEDTFGVVNHDSRQNYIQRMN